MLPGGPISGTFVPTMGTLLDALVPSTRAALLATLFEDPEREFYLLELIRTLAKGRGAVQRELQNLLTAEIITRRDSAGRIYYRVNTGCPIYRELKSIIDKTAGLLPVLQTALAPLDDILVAFVFGSVARGAARSDSDIDLAVVGDVAFRAIVKALASTQMAVGREVNPVLFSVAELRKRAKAKDHFVTELLRADKQFVIGTRDDLETVVGKQVAR